MRSGELMELSTKQMIECNDDGGDCAGGDTYRLLNWLYENKTNIQPLSSNLTFTKGSMSCYVDDKPGIQIKDFSLNK